jgi:drug/metabolite transporter (DMT)-like permease
MPDRHPRLDGRAIALVVACSFLWGLNQVSVKGIVGEVPPLVQATVRSLAGVVMVLAWARWRGIPMGQRDGTLPGGVAAGVLFGGEFACVFLGLQFTTASRMIVFIYLAPFVVALLMPFVSRAERLTRPQLAGLLLAFSGVAFAFAEGFTQPAAGPRQWLGDTLGVVAALLWGATTLVIRATPLATAAPEKTLAWQLGVSGVLLLAASLLNGDRWSLTLSPLAWSSLGFQTVVVVFGSYLVWFWLVRHYQATQLSAFTLLTPVFGLLLGVVLLGEPVTARLLVALAGVVAGIALVNRQPRMRPTSAVVE